MRLESGVYIGKFPLPRYHIPANVLFSGTTTTLSNIYQKCFGLSLNDLSFLPPSLTYVLALDPCYQQIIAAATLSRRLDEIPGSYHQGGNDFYLFNVCTHPCYQGRGYMRDLLQRMFQDVMRYSRSPDKSEQWINPQLPIRIYLLVSSTNQPALHLYRRLGFQIIGSMNKPSGLHEIMVRQFESPRTEDDQTLSSK
jgi:ribosomal protein S18 acetylase RimI-like enzyme